MASRSQLRWAAVLAVLATALNMEVDPTGWAAEEGTNFKRGAEEIFEYVTKPHEVPEFAPVFTNIRESDTRKPFGVGKTFTTTSNIFIDWNSEFVISSLSRPRSSNRPHSIRLESKNYLKPVIDVKVEDGDGDRCKLTMAVHYNRTSALFQYTAAPLLKYITQQHLRHALFSLKWLIPPKQGS